MPDMLSKLQSEKQLDRSYKVHVWESAPFAVPSLHLQIQLEDLFEEAYRKPAYGVLILECLESYCNYCYKYVVIVDLYLTLVGCVCDENVFRKSWVICNNGMFLDLTQCVKSFDVKNETHCQSKIIGILFAI